MLVFFFLANIYFDGKDGLQVYLVFQLVYRYIKVIANTRYIAEWKSKGLFDESIKPSTTSNNSLTPLIDYYEYKMRLKFNGSCLRQSEVMYTHEKAVNIYIIYELAGSSSPSDDRALKNCLFGAVTLAKKADVDNYGYTGYGIDFDRKSSFSFPGSRLGQNVFIFGADMSYSVHVDKERHFSSWKRTSTRIRRHINCRKKVFS